jgi:hypothetical protein
VDFQLRTDYRAQGDQPTAIRGYTPAADAKTSENGLVEPAEATPDSAELRALPKFAQDYAKALDYLLAISAGRPLIRALFMTYRPSMEAWRPPRGDELMSTDSLTYRDRRVHNRQCTHQDGAQ